MDNKSSSNIPEDNNAHETNDEGEDLSYQTTILESKTNLLDDALSAKLEDAFENTTNHIVLHDVAKIAAEYDPIDIAYAVCRLPRQARVIVYDNLIDFEAKVIFVINTNSSTRMSLFRVIPDQEIKELIERMPPDEAVWILDDVSDRRLKRILEILDPKKKERILELQKHDRHSAGRLMNDDFFAFEMNATIGDVSAYIRDNPGIELTRRVFVLDTNSKLIGYVPDRNLIVNRHSVPLRQVMLPILHKITVDATRDEVVDLVERYKIPALPVVDEEERMIGVIAYEDVVEAMEDIADETIANIGGTSEDYSEHEPVLKRFLLRAPWLVVTICAGLTSATIMAHFSGPIWFASVPFFVPLITGISGNVGLQCSTVLVRGISTGEISYGSRYEAMLKEVGIGLVIGSVFGLVSGMVIFLLNHFHVYQETASPFMIGSTVGVGVFCACLMASTLGTISPFVFARLGIDPAVASGPIVTAFNDVLSFLIFLGVAKCIFMLFA